MYESYVNGVGGWSCGASSFEMWPKKMLVVFLSFVLTKEYIAVVVRALHASIHARDVLNRSKAATISSLS